MTLKERIENNLTLFALGLIVAGFTAGFGAYKAISEIGGASQSSTATSGQSQNWQDTARKATWIPQAECPAYPVTVGLTSPGEGAIIEYSGSASPSLQMDTVVQSSRPLPKESAVGLVINEESTTNFYVMFPYFSIDADRKIFRESDFLRLQAKPSSGSKLSMWAIVVDDKRKFGNVYGSLEQVKSAGTEVVVSKKVSFQVKER